MSSSPEYKFKPYIIFTTDDKAEGNITDVQLEFPQYSPLVEASSTLNQYLETIRPYASAALGLVPESIPPVLESNQPLPLGQSVTIDVEQMRAKRRERFEQTGYIPPIAGGSPKQIDLPMNEIASLYRDQHISTAEIAQQFGVSTETIYKRLHEAGELNLIGTRIGDKAFKQMEKKDQASFDRWLVENKEALQQEQEETREVIRHLFGEEFLKQSEETDRAIKEMIRKREKKQMKK
jgi:transposase-like protein